MLKLRILIVISILFSSIITWCQRNDGLVNIREAGNMAEAFEKVFYYKLHKFPFKQIIVLDKRFDSSKLGYTNSGFIKGYSKITLDQSWSATLNSYFINNLDSSSNKSLIIVLKSFWLQRGALDHLVQKKITKTGMAGSGDYGGVYPSDGGACIADMDIYVQSDSTLQALFRIEDVFINMSKRYRRSSLDQFFFLPFDSIARRLNGLSVPDVLAKKRRLSWTEVHNHYDERFKLTILLDGAIKKGVFKTFDDFRQNKPSETNFRFVNGRVTDELYVGDKGNEDIITEYWGFYDGKDLYIQTGLSAFKAIRQQDTFEIFGAKSVNNYHNDPGQNDIRFTGYEIERKILQLNMNTGKIY